MSILDAHKERFKNALSQSGSIVTYNHGSTEPVSEGVSWDPYKSEDSLIKWDSEGPIYRNLYHLKKFRADQTTNVVSFANPANVSVGWNIKLFPVDYLVAVCDAYAPQDAVVESHLAWWPSDPSAEFDARVEKLRFVSTDADFSLPVFLIELVELKHLLKSFRKMYRRIRFLLGHKSKHGRQQTIKTFGDLVSSGILEYAFGVGAFIRDVVSLWKTCSTLSKKYKGFIEGMGVETSARNRVDEQPPLPPRVEFDRTVGGVSMVFAIEYVWVHQPYSCVTAVYRYWSATMTQIWGKYLYFATKLGVEPDPSIVWNLIPLSFVIDWLFPVGEWLHRRRIPLVDLNVTIDGAGYGASSHIRQFILIAHRKPNGSLVAPLSYLSSREWWMTIRARRELIDVPLQTLRFQGVTLRKVVNGSALLWTKLVK